MAKPLTAVTIANLRPKPKDSPKRYEVSDGGCQGLRVVVFPTGRRSFIVRFRYRGLQRKLTLGSVLLTHNGEGEPDTTPQIDTPLSLSAARELATRALRQAKAGEDPAAAKQKKREEQRAAESDTLKAIADEYLRRRGPELRTLSQRKADLDLICSTVLRRQPVDQIKRGQFTRELDRIADARGPVRADRVLSALKTLLSWHAERSDYVSVLGRGGRRTSTSERARSRVLSDDELRRVWTAAEQDKGPFGSFVRFVLLTATRRNEAGGLRRSELSDGGKTWIIPGARYKNGRDILIPLSAAAQQIIAAQPVLGDFVFGATGTRALGGFDERKAGLDKICGVSGYTIHDLRRTSRTLLSRAGVSADIAERCLGHALTGVRGTYDRHAYESEKRHAFEALAAQIEKIVHGPEPKVADLAAERGKRRKHKAPA
jgi:integrase